jgi:hypothetical protein
MVKSRLCWAAKSIQLYSTLPFASTARGSVCISPRQTCVFLVDTLPTLGYTLAGFDDVITSMHTGDSKRARMCFQEARQARHRLTLSLTLKEVHEWQNQ